MKKTDSEVLQKDLEYIVENSRNNRKIKDALLEENGRFCVYTETYFGRADEIEIDHFNPTLKGTNNDGYHNWYLSKARWNKEKGSKWAKFQPCLLPTADDLEERIVYDGGDYILADPQDAEARNLMSLLKLDDPDLADERKRYLAVHKEQIRLSGKDAADYFTDLMADYPPGVHFIRVLKEEFGFIHPNY